MINVEDKHLKMLQEILGKYDHDFFVFGSRTTSHARPLSDVDLFYKDDIPDSVIFRIEEELEDSDLPYTVDLVNYNKCDAAFRAVLDQRHCKLPRARR